MSGGAALGRLRCKPASGGAGPGRRSAAEGARPAGRHHLRAGGIRRPGRWPPRPRADASRGLAGKSGAGALPRIRGSETEGCRRHREEAVKRRCSHTRSAARYRPRAGGLRRAGRRQPRPRDDASRDLAGTRATLGRHLASEGARSRGDVVAGRRL